MDEPKLLSAAEKKELRGIAQRIKPHVHIGKNGLVLARQWHPLRYLHLASEICVVPFDCTELDPIHEQLTLAVQNAQSVLCQLCIRLLGLKLELDLRLLLLADLDLLVKSRPGPVFFEVRNHEKGITIAQWNLANGRITLEPGSRYLESPAIAEQLDLGDARIVNSQSAR